MPHAFLVQGASGLAKADAAGALLIGVVVTGVESRPQVATGTGREHKQQAEDVCSLAV